MNGRIATGFAWNGPKATALAAAEKLPGKDVILAKPQTYMNLSGISVRELLQKYELDVKDLLVLWEKHSFPWAPSGFIRTAAPGATTARNL